MTDLEKALVSTSLINTLFQEYRAGELSNSGELVRKRVAKFMRQRSKSNRKLCLDVIKKCDKSWKRTVSHFTESKLKIEAKATISAIYNYMPKEIEKFANITDKHIENFMIISIDDYEAEKNSSIVVDYLMNDLGFEKKKSLFMGKRNILKNNLIIEGKQIKEGF